MSLARSRALRWIAPFGAAAVVAGVTVGVPALTAGAAGALPHITPRQLLVKVQNAHVSGLSGTVRISADLGLPQLPSPTGADASVQSMLSGTHTLSVAVRGLQQQRIGIHGSLEETELIHNGRDVWIYRSTANKVDHFRLPTGLPSGAASHAMAPGATALSGKAPNAASLTPQALAKQALAAVTPSTRVSTNQQITVAGRAAYVLRLAPRSSASLINHVSIAVDGRTGVPLAVTVAPRGDGKPAIEVAYTSVSLTAPAASTFRFTPPAAAKVTQHTVGQPQMRQYHQRAMTAPHHAKALDHAKAMATMSKQRPTVLGSGWGSVIEMRGMSLAGMNAAGMNARAAGGSGGATLRALLQSGRSVSGAYGTGTLWTSRLLTVLVTSDGRAFVGAVTPQAIESAASSPAAR